MDIYNSKFLNLDGSDSFVKILCVDHDPFFTYLAGYFHKFKNYFSGIVLFAYILDDLTLRILIDPKSLHLINLQNIDDIVYAYNIYNLTDKLDNVELYVNDDGFFTKVHK